MKRRQIRGAAEADLRLLSSGAHAENAARYRRVLEGVLRNRTEDGVLRAIEKVPCAVNLMSLVGAEAEL